MPVDKSKIEWTDSTWSPVTGCTKVSPGCKFCYAERVAKRYWGARKFTDVKIHPDRLDQPLRWCRSRRVFVNSMSDLFHEAVSDEFLDQVFAVMARSDGTKLSGRPRVKRLLSAHTFQVLTKRPERMARYLSDPETPYRVASTVAKSYVGFYPARGGCDWSPWKPWPLPNVWLGVSVEDQARADERIPWLLQTPAAVRFLSVEPLLGPVDLTKWLPFFFSFPGHLRRLGDERAMQTNDDGSVLVQTADGGIAVRPALDWVIVGGESGGPPERALVERCATSAWANFHGAARKGCEACSGTGWAPKPEARTWVRSLRDQCVAAGVPFFYKQWGGPTPKAGGRMLEGREWNEYPR